MSALWGRSGFKMASSPGGKAKSVSAPEGPLMGQYLAGFTPCGANSSTSRCGALVPAAAHPSSAGRKGAAAAVTPSALSSDRREVACWFIRPDLSSFTTSPPRKTARRSWAHLLVAEGVRARDGHQQIGQLGPRPLERLDGRGQRRLVVLRVVAPQREPH